MTADLRTIAATTLRRLAVEMRAAAAIPPRPVNDTDVHSTARNVGQRLLAETRREAVADLERLRKAVPLDAPIPWMEALRQTRAVAANAATADALDAWASAWEASS